MEENSKKNILRSRLKDLVIVLIMAEALSWGGQLLGMLLVGGVLSFFPEKGPVTQTGSTYLLFLGTWILLLLYLWFVKKNRPILKALGTGTKGNNLKMIALGVFFGAGLNLICASAAVLRGDIQLTFDQFSIPAFIFLLFAVCVQSGAEESIYRMYVFQRIRRNFSNKWIAIAVNAAVFGAIHIGNDGITPLSFINLVLMGTMYTLMIYYFDSFWCPVIAHTTWNFTQNIVLGLPNSGNILPYSIFKLNTAAAVNSIAYDIGFGLEGTIVACVVQVLACAAILIWGEKKKKAAPSVWELEA